MDYACDGDTAADSAREVSESVRGTQLLLPSPVVSFCMMNTEMHTHTHTHTHTHKHTTTTPHSTLSHTALKWLPFGEQCLKNTMRPCESAPWGPP